MKGSKRRYPVAKITLSWTPTEDQALIRLVNKHGEGNWSTISRELNALFDRDEAHGRIGKQCRERYNHHLRTDISKDPWTDDEEIRFVELHRKYGNKWSEIARCMPGRTENQCKNHFFATMRRKETGGARGQAVLSGVLRTYMCELGLLHQPCAAGVLASSPASGVSSSHHDSAGATPPAAGMMGLQAGASACARSGAASEHLSADSEPAAANHGCEPSCAKAQVSHSALADAAQTAQDSLRASAPAPAGLPALSGLSALFPTMLGLASPGLPVGTLMQGAVLTPALASVLAPAATPAGELACVQPLPLFGHAGAAMGLAAHTLPQPLWQGLGAWLLQAHQQGHTQGHRQLHQQQSGAGPCSSSASDSVGDLAPGCSSGTGAVRQHVDGALCGPTPAVGNPHLSGQAHEHRPTIDSDEACDSRQASPAILPAVAASRRVHCAAAGGIGVCDSDADAVSALLALKG